MPAFDERAYLHGVLSRAVDAFEKTGERPDAFTRFDLPRTVTDLKEIDTRIDVVVKFWNKQKTNPRYQKLLGVLLDAREMAESKTLLRDPRARAAYTAMLDDRHRRGIEAALEGVDQAAAVVASKGFLTPAELQTILDTFAKPPLTTEDVRRRLAAIPVREPAPPAEIPVLPPARMREFRGHLAVLNCGDVWTFLGIPARSPASVVQAACKAKAAEWHPKPPDNRKTSADRLLSMARQWLTDDDAILYDNTLLFERLEEALGPLVDVALADHQIDQGELANLLEKAEALGAQDFIARAFIERRVKTRGGVIAGPAPAADTVLCKACFRRSPVGQDRCLNAACNQALWTTCPRCDHRKALADPRCRACGFNQADSVRVEYLKVVTGAALDSGDLATARGKLGELEALWGRQPDVERLFTRLEERAKEVRALFDACETSIRRKLWYDARSRLDALIAQEPDFTTENGRRADARQVDVDQAIARVEEVVSRGESAAALGRFDEAYARFAEARRLAADVQLPAIACPPQPARNVEATFHHDHMAIAWQASPSGGPVEYLVIRREDRPPVSPTDGVEVGRLRGTGVIDRTLRPGTVVCYAVFACRDGALAEPAVCGGVQATAEVAELALTVGDGEITGTWDQPAGCLVRVFRQVGGPPEPGEGEPVEVTYRAFFDSALRNGEPYGYRVQAEYTLPDGQIVTTPGITATATPHAPPRPVRDLALTAASDGGLTLAWTPPPAGVVALHRVTTRPRWTPGAALSSTDREGLGAPISARVIGDTWQDRTPLPGVSYYLPLTLQGELAIAGAAVEYVAVPDVTGLEVEDFEGYLQLRWAWPPGCTQALVMWRSDTFPTSADDESAQRVLFNRGEYESRGGFRIERPLDVPHRIKVFAGAPVDGATRFASGIEPTCQAEVRTSARTVLSYQLSRGWLRRRRFTISLTTSVELAATPELVVVVKRGRDRPLDVEDGLIVETIPARRLHVGSRARHVVDLSDVEAPFCVRLFLRDPRAYEAFRLQDPHTTSMRVG